MRQATRMQVAIMVKASLADGKPNSKLLCTGNSVHINKNNPNSARSSNSLVCGLLEEQKQPPAICLCQESEDCSKRATSEYLPKLLTTSETAEVLRCSAKTILRHLSSGKLTGTKVGGIWLFAAADISAVFVDGLVRKTSGLTEQRKLSKPEPQDEQTEDQPQLKSSLFLMK
jgi:excisionase family DNA binding protein